MAFNKQFLIFLGFIAIIHAVKSENSYEWNVERSSVNPLSYTDEYRYSRHWTTRNPFLVSARINCPVNEHYSRCDANCQKTCNNYNKLIPCSRVCIWGCICDLGLVRGPDKRCIKPVECPNKHQAAAQQFTTENPQFQETEYPPFQETDYPPFQQTEYPPFQQTEYPPFQETEYPPFQETENRAVSQSNQWPIPLFCRSNELIDPCPSTCPDDCNNFRNKDRNCRRFCIPSCVCKNGFVRSPEGKCIKPYECPKEKNFCPKGEEYSSCHSHCEGNCIHGEDNNCKKVGMLCVPGCTCKSGLVRGPEGTCIYPTECPTTPPQEPPTKVCPENELYEECKAACQQNCSNVDSPLPCPRICVPGCVCKESMIRGKYGKCVETDECPKDNSPPDFYVTMNPPPYTHDDNLISDSVTKTPPISETENPLYEETEIPPLPLLESYHKCPRFERWVVCSAHCERSCKTKDDEVIHCSSACIPGCVCEEGLVRGPHEECIEKDKCPAESNQEKSSFPFPIPLICGSNEFLDPCPSTCQDDCTNYKDTNRKCQKICVPKCVCKSGFVRGPKGNCIKSSECPDDNKDTCRPDEMFSACHGNCEKNCSNWAFDLVCPKKCVSGCVCRPGRVRGKDGKCVVWSQCMRAQNSIIYSEVSSTETPPPTEEIDNRCPGLGDNFC